MYQLKPKKTPLKHKTKKSQSFWLLPALLLALTGFGVFGYSFLHKALQGKPATYAGATQSQPVTQNPLPVVPKLPKILDQSPPTPCIGNTTVMNIVAHQDDDLLFMSPALLNNIQAKHCIRTVYLTAGDAGSDPAYWLNREERSKSCLL